MIKPYRKYEARNKKEMTDGAALHLLDELKENRYPYAYCKEVAKKLDELVEQRQEELDEAARGKLYAP